MDPVTGSVIVAAIAAIASIANVVLTGRNSQDRLRDQETIRKQRKAIEDLGGDPDDL